MNDDVARLYDLLPAIDRVRDEEQGGPLREYLSVIASQVAVLEENLEQLYDDQFIETCADWVVPYIGGLIGYRSLHGQVPRISSPRAEVAHTIAFRRRKGTAAMLEQLARDVTSWDANVVEYFLRLGDTQHMNHVRLGAWYAPDLRAWEPLERVDSPFDDVPHTVDVRDIARGAGRHNIPNVGIFLWRLVAYPLTRSPAVKVDARRYLFSPLGCDVPLFSQAAAEPEISHLARPINVPAPISRRALEGSIGDYYGSDRSILVAHDGADAAPSDVVAADLSDAGGGAWAHQPSSHIAIDPVLGRLAFPDAAPPPADVLVSFHYGFAADLGGGEYDRRATIGGGGPMAEVVTPGPIQPALDAVRGGGAAEIADSGRYTETPQVAADLGARVELRAANHHRPTLVLGGDLVIEGDAESEVTIAGLLVTGGLLRVPATAGQGLRLLRLRHCTLVPGRSLDADGTPAHPEMPSLVVEQPGVDVEIDHCILGGIRVAPGARLTLSDSILDATSRSAVAYAAPDGDSAGGQLQVVDTTVIGKVHTLSLEYASNAIFLARLATGDPWPQAIRSERRQAGCVRFSWLHPSAATPRRYRCQPDLEIETRLAAAEAESGPLSDAERERIRSEVLTWLVPRLTSTRYGDPGYAQLNERCPVHIREGADDEAEMGAFHELFAPQRETNVRVRLDEYLRLGLEADVFHAT